MKRQIKFLVMLNVALVSMGCSSPSLGDIIITPSNNTYEVIRLIGSGYWGDVQEVRPVSGASDSFWTVTAAPVRQPLALKCMKSDNSDISKDYDGLAQFNNASLTFIPRAYESFKIGSRSCMLMDMVGADIVALWKSRGGLPMVTVASFVLDLVNKLEKIHKLGVTHQDGHAGNCAVGLPGTDTANSVFLLDWGNSIKSNSTTDRILDLQYAVFNIRYLKDLDGRFMSAGYYKNAHEKDYPLDKVIKDVPSGLREAIRYVYTVKDMVDYEHLRNILYEFIEREGYKFDDELIWPTSTVLV